MYILVPNNCLTSKNTKARPGTWDFCFINLPTINSLSFANS